MNNAEITVNNSDEIDELLFSIMDSTEFKSIQFLIITIRRQYLKVLSTLRTS